MLKEGMELDGARVSGANGTNGAGAGADSNNNRMRGNREKSYSLRPRAGTKKEDEEFEVYDSWRPRGVVGGGGSVTGSTNGVGLGVGDGVGIGAGGGRTKKRLKQKPQPLSKYRRKTANARERSRMREINEAFEALRRIIPHLGGGGGGTGNGNAGATNNPGAGENNSEKLTKISTLRSAMKYISALRRILQEPGVVEGRGCQEGYEYGGDSDGESLLSDCLTPLTHFDALSTPSNHGHSFCDDMLSPSFDLDDSVGSISLGVGGVGVGVGGGAEAGAGFEPHSPYNSCFSGSNLAEPDSDLEADDSTQHLIDSNLGSSVFDSCLDVPVFGAQFS